MASHEKFTLAEVVERQKEVTDKISTQVRNVSVGVILFAWSVLSASPNSKLADISKSLLGLIGLVALMAVGALIVDYVQYVLAVRVVSIVLSDTEAHKTHQYEYPDQHAFYRAQYWCFWGKQILCGAAIFFTLLTVFIQFLLLT